MSLESNLPASFVDSVVADQSELSIETSTTIQPIDEDGSTNSSLNPSTVENSLASTLFALFKRCTVQFEEAVNEVNASQSKLHERLSLLDQDINKFAQAKDSPVDLVPYVDKLKNYEQRMLKIQNSLRHSQDRINKLKQLWNIRR